jgi:uncharacterized membrane protein
MAVPFNRARWRQLGWALGLAAVVSGSARADYVSSSFLLPGAMSSSIWDINDKGQLVGSANDGSSNFGYLYDAGNVTRLNGPTGAMSAGAIGISETGVVVGSWTAGPGTLQQPYVYSGGTYTLSGLSIPGATAVYARGISPDAHYLTGYYTKTTGGNAGFVYDLLAGSMSAILDAGSVSLIAQGINSYGQVVGNYSSSGVSRGFIYDLHTAVRTDFAFSGTSNMAPRAINDQGQIAGWLTFSGGLEQAWIGTAAGYQLLPGIAGQHTVGEGINNLGQVVGFYTDPELGGQSPGFISSPAVLPGAPGADPHVYTFSTTVVADAPIFIDPLVAVGYSYKTGAGDPRFKTVSLPAGIGDNQYEIVVLGQHFFVAGNEIFDFTAHGFAGGVDEFTVLGIEPEAQLDPASGSAFVTRLTFAGSGSFTGTQTAITADYIAPVPEAGRALMLGSGLAGLAGLRGLARRRQLTRC